MIVHVKELQQSLESSFVADIKAMGDRYVKMYENNPASAQAELTKYSANAARKVCEAWDQLYIYLLVKYNDGNVKKETNGKFIKTDGAIPQCASPEHPEYPEKWYKMIVDDCGKNISNKGVQ